jgi:hypothetical protein
MRRLCDRIVKVGTLNPELKNLTPQPKELSPSLAQPLVPSSVHSVDHAGRHPDHGDRRSGTNRFFRSSNMRPRSAVFHPPPAPFSHATALVLSAPVGHLFKLQ